MEQIIKRKILKRYNTELMTGRDPFHKENWVRR
jgi:hypothetical protein